MTVKKDDYLIGTMVRYHRKKARLTQAALAKSAGVGKTAVFDLEQGKKAVRLKTLQQVLHVLNIRLKFEGPLMGRFEEEYEKG